ncbi:unnamed protein product [Vicia faba]|uniref:Uncharacterized protein n=1 Tax=Vicia faba TaxID=3906 RepID=A0AAV1AYW4_VICFA|nr:unnamed protein product [Vicia faba]
MVEIMVGVSSLLTLFSLRALVLLKLNISLIMLHYHLNCQRRESLMIVVLVKHHLLGTISPNYPSLKLHIQPPLATTLVREFRQVSFTSGGVRPSVTTLDAGQSSQSQPTVYD